MNDLCEFIVRFGRLGSVLGSVCMYTLCVVYNQLFREASVLFGSQQFEVLALFSVVTGMEFVGCKEEIWSVFFSAISI